MPTALRTPVVRRARRCARKPRSSPAVHVVEEAEQRDERDPGIAAIGVRPAGERQPEPAVVDAERARRQHRVEQLAPPVEEARGVATRGSVVEVDLDLLEGEAGAQRVDGHAHLAAEARREREADGPGARAHEPLAGQRLPGADARAQPDQLPPHALGEAEAAADPPAERGHRQVGLASGERAGAIRAGRRRRAGAVPAAPRARRPTAPRPFRAAPPVGRRRRRPPPARPCRSSDRPSTTITSASGKSRRRAATVSAMRSSSFRAGDEDGQPRGRRGATHPRPAAGSIGGTEPSVALSPKP